VKSTRRERSNICLSIDLWDADLYEPATVLVFTFICGSCQSTQNEAIEKLNATKKGRLGCGRRVERRAHIATIRVS
jgi:hypothetical protein